ncbi:MAG: hypothetical protein WBM69_29570 [Desulfobacterales bacterium]
MVVEKTFEKRNVFDNHYIGHFSEILSDFIILGYQTGHSKKIPFNLMRLLIPAEPGPLSKVEFGAKILHLGNLNQNFFFTKQEITGIVRVKRLPVQSEFDKGRTNSSPFIKGGSRWISFIPTLTLVRKKLWHLTIAPSPSSAVATSLKSS